MKVQLRRGTATVELAVCLPILVLLVIGMIEAANMIYLKQAITAAAHLSVRVVIENDAVPADAALACSTYLDSRGVKGYELTITPEDVSGLDRGAAITATVSAPCDANSAYPSWFFGGRVFHSQVTMARESGTPYEDNVPQAPQSPGGKPNDRGSRNQKPLR